MGGLYCSNFLWKGPAKIWRGTDDDLGIAEVCTLLGKKAVSDSLVSVWPKMGDCELFFGTCFFEQVIGVKKVDNCLKRKYTSGEKFDTGLQRYTTRNSASHVMEFHPRGLGENV